MTAEKVHVTFTPAEARSLLDHLDGRREVNQYALENARDAVALGVAQWEEAMLSAPPKREGREP